MPYHEPAEFTAEVERLAAVAGARARLEIIGTSVEGRPIHAVTVRSTGTARDPGDRPQALVIAAMHGCEVVSSELALALLGSMCAAAPVGDAAALLDRADVTVVPCVNPDGRSASLASLARSGWFQRAPRRNARGVDLNRNWPFPEGVRDHWLPIAGTSRSWLPWYRGPAPLSEPESVAVATLAERLRPFALLNLHSTGSIVTHPWSSKEQPPDDQAGFDRMIGAFRDAQVHVRYRSKQSRAWYPIVGSSNDWFHDRFGTLAVTVETSPPAGTVKRDLRKARWFFWYANPIDPEWWIENDLPGCLASLVAAHDHRFAPTSGPFSDSVQPPWR